MVKKVKKSSSWIAQDILGFLCYLILGIVAEAVIIICFLLLLTYLGITVTLTVVGILLAFCVYKLMEG